MELKFGMPLQFRTDLQNSDDSKERNAYQAWRERFDGKTVYLVGWCDSAFAVVDRLGDYGFEFISGSPDFLFETALRAA